MKSNPVAEHMNHVCKPSTHANKSDRLQAIGLHRLEVERALDEILDGNLEDFDADSESLGDISCSNLSVED